MEEPSLSELWNELHLKQGRSDQASIAATKFLDTIDTSDKSQARRH